MLGREGGGWKHREKVYRRLCRRCKCSDQRETRSSLLKDTGREEDIKMPCLCGSYFCRIMTVVFHGKATGKKENIDSKTKLY